MVHYLYQRLLHYRYGVNFLLIYYGLLNYFSLIIIISNNSTIFTCDVFITYIMCLLDFFFGAWLSYLFSLKYLLFSKVCDINCVVYSEYICIFHGAILQGIRFRVCILIRVLIVRLIICLSLVW